MIGLFGDVVPKTVENFAKLCTGEAGTGNNWLPLHYKGNRMHRIVRDNIIQGGDIILNNGKGGESIYGANFPDENFDLKHDRPFLVSMANSGPDTNNSQFFFTLREQPHLDGKHVVFGQVISGFETLYAMNKMAKKEKNATKPVSTITIVDSGLL